jgi:four helix bundle protein
MTRVEFQARTMRFALDVLRCYARLPSGSQYGVIGRQLIRSATSVGANHRAALRSRSRADFIAKMGLVEEEADESMYWMDLLLALGTRSDPEWRRLREEANQLVSIVVASRKTAKQRR